MAPVSGEPERFDWRWRDVAGLYLYFVVLVAGILALPADILGTPMARGIFGGLGLLGVWRFAWWFTHFIRAQIYTRVVYARLRREGEALWARGWRPREVAFMMTTFKEDPATTRAVLDSIVSELVQLGVPGRLVIGSGHASDEEVITAHLATVQAPVKLEVVFVRQTLPGKRIAIGLALRAMSRIGIGGDTPVVFLDGDSLMAPGCLARCLPIFELEPKVDALTTLERAIVRGPILMQKWLDLRFAQRHLTMNSHALSKKVLTLTGRLSVYRARAVLDEAFISTVEEDYLDDWLWGRFRFLSGDDKSTWYCLLQRGAEMRYVPDALVYTIERLDGSLFDRVIQNLLRWSGNMLRNGRRAIRLGPTRVGFFIWWCIVDQRIAMWSCLAGPVALIGGGLLLDPALLVTFPLWVMLTRGVQSCLLFPYHRRIDVSFPFVLYFNQIAASVIKIYILFRLPVQRWANRGDQRANDALGHGWRWKSWMASYLTTLWISVFVFGVLLLTGTLPDRPLAYVVSFLDTFL
ncbi:MAG: glycosyltransferase [Pseudomonadota bacterium]|nr:glycosyltransferase [Pseudomonadota bacterium]